jgi:aminomethyltransferase
MASRTPLYERHLAAGGRMVDFAGWLMPQQYTSVKEEQEAVRTRAGVFDVSHMGRFELAGAGDAAGFLQELVTNDVGKLSSNHAQYNLLCLEDGGVIDDLVVYRGVDTWTLVVNASNRSKDLTWLRQHAPPEVEIVDRTQETGLLALQGPEAEALMPAAGVDLAAIPYFGMAVASVGGVDCTISRTGYTGEDGFELFVSSERLGEVWDALLGAGALPCGLAARDVCRLEAGLRLYGNDMDETVNPYEAGLGWTVKLKKGEFIGRAALEGVKAEGPRRHLAGILSSGRTIPRHGVEVKEDGATVGFVTSGTYSFWLGKGIGMAMLESGEAEPGRQLELAGRGGSGGVEVAPLPFYRGSVRQAARA